ncbi:MAG: preprotein translocase subunit SecA [Opitutales bacterium]|nr:preprotein translocase subunit SecA [Opitutales bacterium]
MIGFIYKKLKGRTYRKFVRNAQPVVAKINALEKEYQSLSDEQLRAKTEEFKARFKQGETLEQLLPEAFATVKNAARRLCGRNVQVRGHELKWEMVHFDVQLIGGMALHRNMVAEMATGEGKTLVATLPLYLNALTGRNCQLVTVNEYLAQRDAEWMGHLYNFLGLSVGVILGAHQQSPEMKREMYNRDITYGTASEFGFDYLRDNGMATRKGDLSQRDHYFCIIDEVDSILIDEARTPLIISGPSNDGDVGDSYRALRPSIEQLVRAQSTLCNNLASEVKAGINEESDSIDLSEEQLEKLLLVKWGAPRNKVYTRMLENGSIRKAFDKYDMEMNTDYYRKKRYALKETLYFVIDEKGRSADLTEMGRNLLAPDDPDAFVMPDMPSLFQEIDNDPEIDTRTKEQQKAMAQQRFEQISSNIHSISQLLRAYSIYERDVDYVVQEGKVLIVDENTGRTMPGRRWSEGLHQAIEAKEGVAIEKETKTYATITLQNYFRLYEKLAGMTGTAETEANEFKDIYNLEVMVVPTHRPCIRVDDNDLIYKTRREKYNAVVDEITEAHKRGQPCLVGTVSVDASEILSRMLKRAGIPHNVLNAKYHQQEAEIVSRAGWKGAVTIATNMAGRGTDIKLGEGVAEAGGLYVIGTERHTSRRIDRQLRGRSSRQGDPGKTKFFMSLEDDLMRLYSNQGFAGKILENSFEPGQPLEHRWLNIAIERAQKTVEQIHYSSRKRLLQYDDVLNQQREVIYGLRGAAISSDKPRDTIFYLIDEEVSFRLDSYGIDEGVNHEEENLKAFFGWVYNTFPIAITLDECRGHNVDEIKEIIMGKVREAYATKESVEDPDALIALERYVVINSIDRNWQNHLTEMEDLRQGVNLRSYGQKDPLQEYKNEAFTLFEQMMNVIRAQVSGSIFRSATSVQAFQSLIQMLRKARQSGPEEVAGGNQELPGAPQPAAPRMAIPPQRLPSRPPQMQQAAPAAAPKSAPSREVKEEVTLPKVSTAPKFLSGMEPSRNDTVVIRRGNETQELKYKKAKTMIENEGWMLVRIIK